MAQIVNFMKLRKDNSIAERDKALANGQIEYFICNNCGERIEVINGEYPDCCPGCAYRITKWNDAEENV